MNTEADTTPVFVYGTLLSGEANHRLIEHASFLGEALTLPDFELADLGPYPALVLGGATAVRGELYAVTPALLRVIDRLEGHPGFYRRVSIAVADGRPSVTYILEPGQAQGYPRITSGDWRRRR